MHKAAALTFTLLSTLSLSASAQTLEEIDSEFRNFSVGATTTALGRTFEQLATPEDDCISYVPALSVSIDAHNNKQAGYLIDCPASVTTSLNLPIQDMLGHDGQPIHLGPALQINTVSDVDTSAGGRVSSFLLPGGKAQRVARYIAVFNREGDFALAIDEGRRFTWGPLLVFTRINGQLTRHDLQHASLSDASVALLRGVGGLQTPTRSRKDEHQPWFPIEVPSGPLTMYTGAGDMRVSDGISPNQTIVTAIFQQNAKYLRPEVFEPEFPELPADRDNDGVPDADDNCPDHYNPSQWKAPWLRLDPNVPNISQQGFWCDQLRSLNVAHWGSDPLPDYFARQARGCSVDIFERTIDDSNCI